MVEKIKRKINHEIYIIALLITSIFFVAGITVGDYIAYQKADSLEVSQKAISAFLRLSEVKNKILENQSKCNLNWGEIWNEKVEIGNILAALELRFGKEDEKIIKQKKIYNEVQFNTLRLVNEIKKDCNYNWTTILFFYTNKQGSSELSELQGYALDTVYNMNREKIKIFSFDININDVYTRRLMEEYDIVNIPSIVIDNKVYGRFMSRNEIQQVIY